MMSAVLMDIIPNSSRDCRARLFLENLSTPGYVHGAVRSHYLDWIVSGQTHKLRTQITIAKSCITTLSVSFRHIVECANDCYKQISQSISRRLSCTSACVNLLDKARTNLTPA